MKSFKDKIILSVGSWVIIALALLPACQKSHTEPVQLTPLQALVNSDTTLTFFHRMILQANETALLGNNPMTLLLPDNAAFRAAGFTEKIIDSLSASRADRMISYHFLTSQITADSSSYKGYPTMTGYSVYGFTDGAHQTWFNGTPLKNGGASTKVGNVQVYRISLPLQGPADSLPQLLASDSSLSFLAEAFRRTNLYDSLLLTGSFTILAPVNNAFRMAGYDSVGAIDSANFSQLLSLVKFHVSPAFNFSNILTGLSAIPVNPDGSGSVKVSVQNGILQFAGNGNSIPANFISGNQTAGNTIILHRLDRVLFP